jgi:hypothetical protein
MTRRRSPTLLLLGALLMPGAVLALDYQVHGFASQGFVLSEGNDLYGDSRDGSFDFYELGINGTALLLPRLIVSGQLLLRDAGATDDEGLRVDYALADYQFLSEPAAQLGLRAGRVRNPLGFYNDTQDVIFTRPGILLPPSVYLSGQGFRSVLFASDGLQPYGALGIGSHYLSLASTLALDRDADEDEKRRFSGGASPPNDIRFRDFYLTRLQDEWGEGSWQAALSHVHGNISIEPAASSPFSAEFKAYLLVFSLRYAQPRYSITGEYQLIAFEGRSTGRPPFRSKSDGFYLQGDYLFAPRWSAMLRYDAFFTDRNDRDGRERAAATGADRHGRYAHDVAAGLRWLPDAHWGAWAEYHHIDGSATVSAFDNPGRQPAARWSALLLMVGYRF